MIIAKKFDNNFNQKQHLKYINPKKYKNRQAHNDFKRILQQYMNRPNLFGVVTDGKPCVVSLYGECMTLADYLKSKYE